MAKHAIIPIEGLEEAVLANLAMETPRKWQDVAADLNCNLQSIYRRLRLLEKQGRIPEGAGRRYKRRKAIHGTFKFESGQRANLMELMKLAADTGEVSHEDQLKIAAYIATNGKNMEKVAALKLIREMMPPDRKRVGPPPPTTDDEMVTRLGDMMASLPPERRSDVLAYAASKDVVIQYDQLAQEVALQDSNISSNDGGSAS